jgi:hypothetical protein
MRHTDQGYLVAANLGKQERSGVLTAPRVTQGGRDCLVEFRTSEGDVLAISIPRNEAAVIQHFQERMPYGLFVLDDPSAVPWPLR